MFGLLIIDLLTKYLFFDLELAKNLIFIYPMFNLGISRSMNVPSFVSICVGWISLLLFILIYHKKYISWRMAALLIAGTLGNMIDRIYFGGVRDFIMIGKWFPIFNIADVLLNLWILAYFRKEFFAWKSKSKKYN
jgi:signal peptidase II